jgi:hypothetical protein
MNGGLSFAHHLPMPPHGQDIAVRWKERWLKSKTN